METKTGKGERRRDNGEEMKRWRNKKRKKKKKERERKKQRQEKGSSRMVTEDQTKANWKKIKLRYGTIRPITSPFLHHYHPHTHARSGAH